MVGLVFIVSAALVVFAATKLAQFGDVIAARTGLGRLFVGTLLLAGATSLPELLTSINSLTQGVPDLAAGNFMGSNMFNMFLLGVLDLVGRQTRVLRRVAMRHALTAGLAILLSGLAVFFVLAGVEVHIGWIGLDSLLIAATYITGLRLIQANNPAVAEAAAETADLEGMPALYQALIGFGAAAALLVVVSPWLVSSSKEIAAITGLGTGFIGTALVGVVTSLPEVATSIAAVQIGAYDMAVGNLFGSNAFNMFALSVTDAFYLQGRFFGVIAPEFALVGLLGLILTGLGLIGNLARLDRRLGFVEVDSLVIMIGYIAGLAFLYVRGIGA
ncbi:MAG: sodium:calcium antiporter [Anaerolineae bacterium]|nr:sodium:calcium antiporter [Anaerolineae bacterium]